MRRTRLPFLGSVALIFSLTGAPAPPRSRGADGPEGQSRPTPSDESEKVWPAAAPAALDSHATPAHPPEGERPRRRPFSNLSSARILSDLSELTSIGNDRLYRTSGTSGESEAFEWLASRLGDLRYLRSIGASVERQTFRVPLASEVRTAALSVWVGGAEVTVAAHALQGHRDDLQRALRFDSDGRPNDDEPDTVIAEGSVTVVRQMAELNALAPGSLRGSVLVADYALLDRGVVTTAVATQAAAALLRPQPAALVLVTRYSNVRGQAHGSFAGDVSALISLLDPPAVPTVYVKLEDLAPTGIVDLSQLGRIGRARVTWDADVFSPGTSQLLALRIPGIDGSRAVLVGAHLDSPNSPGALDNGSGSAALLAAARALDEGFTRPPVDTVLLWFGSHERGLYSSSVFAASHSELLDRAIAMVQLDCLTHLLDGMSGGLVLEGTSYRAVGDSRLPLPEAMRDLASPLGVGLYPLEASGVVSDNSSFDGFDVPSGNTVFLSMAMNEVHVDGHLHDPYDDMPLARLHGRELVDLAAVALGAILDLPSRAPLRVTPTKTSRAVFVASHTEAVHMTPAHQAILGKALAWEGWDVDVVPYGTPLTDADLAGAGLVVVLPVIDYPTSLGGTDPYDESWSAEEVGVLRRYVDAGGFLVLTNSASRLRYGFTPVEENEDWADANAVGQEFGILFQDRRLSGTATPTADHPLLAGVSQLTLAEGNGLAVAAPSGEVLASANGAALVLVPIGSQGGEVLALGDLAILGNNTSGEAPNLAFLRNLARYARQRAPGAATRPAAPERTARAAPTAERTGCPDEAGPY